MRFQLVNVWLTIRLVSRPASRAPETRSWQASSRSTALSAHSRESKGPGYSTTHGDYRPRHRCGSVAAGASRCAVVEAIDGLISGVGTLDVIPGARSTIATGELPAAAECAWRLSAAASEALVTTRPMRLSQAPAVLGHHQGRQLLREPHHRRVLCVG
jgi:hypothetical protein